LSSTERAARLVKLLKAEEWKTLEGLERASEKVGFADQGIISRLSGLPIERVNFALGELNKRGVVRGRGATFVPTLSAIEALALREHVRRDRISALGAIIARGKESDVYEAFREDGELLALKCFRIGRTSFRDVTRKRFVDKSGTKSWIARNYEAARREYLSLKRLDGLTKSVPKAVAYDRNTVLLEELNGVKLLERPELEDPRTILKEIIDCVRDAYLKARMVNGDLSEYNILTDGKIVWLIDWPQAVRTTHPNSGELLSRDLHSVLKFFKRVYKVEAEPSEILRYVFGETRSFEIKRAEPSSPR